MRILNLLEAKTPITHMMGVSGNEALLNREKIFYKNEIKAIPVLSGNALRHRMIRKTGAQWLIEQLELKGKLNITQLNFLFHGGALAKSTSDLDIKVISDMQQYLPLYRLLGGSLTNQIMHGSLICGRGILICYENALYLENMLDIDYDFQTLPNSESFVTKYQYTRGDAIKSQIEYLEPESKDQREKSDLMIFGGQAITKGAIFAQEMITTHDNPVEIGALLHSMELWIKEGATVGGQSSKGHGQFIVSSNINETERKNFINEYVEHVQKHKKEAIAWIMDVFK